MLDPSSFRELLSGAGQGRIYVAEVGGRERAPLATAFVLFSHSEQVHTVQSPGFPGPFLPLNDGYTGRVFFFFSFVNLTQARVIWEGGNSVEKMSPSARSVGKTVGCFLDQ